MRKLKTRLMAGLVVFAAATAALSAASPALAADKVLDATEIQAELKAEGRVRVLVRLVTEWNGTDKPHWASVPEGYLAALPSEQNAAIRALFGSDALKAGALASQLSIKRSRYAPGFTASITAADLARLQRSDLVVSVQVERVFRPVLDASLPRINAAGSFARAGDGRGTSVAVIDTGVLRTHPFLTGKVAREACFSSNIPGLFSSLCANGGESQTGAGSGGPCSLAISGCDHGTHVAGIAAGRNTIATGPRSGVARAARIVAIKASSRSENCGSGPSPCAVFNPLDILDSMGFVIERVRNNDIAGAPIAAVNLSLGDGGNNSGDCDLVNALFKAQVDELRGRGVATVIASGNEDRRNGVGSPACVSTAIAVGSTDTATDAVSNFTSMGAMVDLLAPGSVIESSVPGAVRFAGFQGTSMAAPHVAGAIADLRSRVRTATVTRIERALKDTGVAIADTRSGGIFTRRRIDVGRAVTRLIAVNPDVSATPTTRQVMNKVNLIEISPSRVPFTLIGRGSAFRFQVENVPLFLEVDRSSGTIAADGRFTVNVRPSAAAFFLPTGTYDANIRVVNRDALGDVALLRVRLQVP